MNNYYETFIDFWIPIYKVQIFKARFNQDINALLDIKENIYKNIHFTKEQRKSIVRKLDIYHLF